MNQVQVTLLAACVQAAATKTTETRTTLWAHAIACHAFELYEEVTTKAKLRGFFK